MRHQIRYWAMFVAGADHAGEDHSSETHEKQDLREIVLSGASLASTKLKESIPVDALLNGAILVKANLEKADFSEAVLDGADLSDAKLKRADLAGASLQGVNVSDLQNVVDENFRDAYWDDDSELHAEMDPEIMIYVPEPGGKLSLASGIGGLTLLGRSRSRG